jgi:hypothetical protein
MQLKFNFALSARSAICLAFCLIALFARGANGGAAGSLPALKKELASALVREDAEAIRNAVTRINESLGASAGVPDVRDQYLPIPANGVWLSAAEVASGFTPAFKEIEKLRWWKIGLDPAKLGHALREPAAIVAGNVAVVAAARRGAKLEGAARSLEMAKDAGDFLLWAQERAGTGGFPFPASRGVSSAAPFRAAERQLKLAEKQGRLDEVVRNGWAIRDDGDGGLQFDNAECGVALFELYDVTKDQRYLDAAKRSADWAAAQPLVANWNYNSFSVYLLARAYRVTGAQSYLDTATRKALLGVIPGQLTTGVHAGRWGDAHNARPSYHYIMLRSLAELAAALPRSNSKRVEILSALKLGLRARNKDILGPGAPNKDKAIETLLMVNQLFADDPVFLKETLSAEALDALGKLVSAQARRGRAPLGPREWGMFLSHAAQRGVLSRTS